MARLMVEDQSVMLMLKNICDRTFTWFLVAAAFHKAVSAHDLAAPHEAHFKTYCLTAFMVLPGNGASKSHNVPV